MLTRVLCALTDGSPLEWLPDRLSAASGHVIREVGPRESVSDALDREPTDVLLVDGAVLADQGDGSLASIRGRTDAPAVAVLIATASSDRRAALQAEGAAAVLDAEGDGESLLLAIEGVLGRIGAQTGRVISAKHVSGPAARLGDFASSSPSMREFLSLVRRVVDTSSTLMVLGETGVGKEYLSRAIHDESPRAGQPFVPVHCGALSSSLLESELFGHVEGAFTGAHRGRRGYFELAHGGTLFLDEVGELEPSVQVKLLRVLQDRRIQPVGGESDIEVDVRLIAATNRDLVREVKEGRFRADLFYRLSVVRLEVPPLRARREDIEALFLSNVEHFAREMGRPARTVSEPALEALVRYDWPGNVRELINVAERAVILGESARITEGDLPVEVSAPDPPASRERGDDGDSSGRDLRPFKEARDALLEEFEADYLRDLLTESRGHMNDAAELSGLNSRSLYEKMKRHGLRKEAFRARRR